MSGALLGEGAVGDVLDREADALVGEREGVHRVRRVPRDHVVERHLHARPDDLGERARQVEMGERRKRFLRTPAERIAVPDSGDRRSRGVRRHEPQAPLVSRVVEPSDVHADLHVVEDVGRLAQRGALAQVLVEDSGDLALLRLLAPPSDRRHDGDEDRERCDDEDGRAHSVSIVATSPPIGDAARDR